MKTLFATLILAVVSFGQTAASQSFVKWISIPCAIHASTVLADAATSWNQPEGNALLATNGRFQHAGAERMALATGAVIGITYAIGKARPGWRRCLGILNLSMAGAHAGAAAWNLSQNPRFH